MHRMVGVAVVMSVVVCATPVTWAREGAVAQQAVAPRSDTYVSQFGWGLGALGTNLFYVPVKLLYATAGGVTGALAFVLTAGRADAAQRVWSPSLGGTYVLTPGMLRGEEPIFFSGESYE